MTLFVEPIILLRLFFARITWFSGILQNLFSQIRGLVFGKFHKLAIIAYFAGINFKEFLEISIEFCDLWKLILASFVHAKINPFNVLLVWWFTLRSKLKFRGKLIFVVQASSEVQSLNRFYRILSNEPDRAYYGYVVL